MPKWYERHVNRVEHGGEESQVRIGIRDLLSNGFLGVLRTGGFLMLLPYQLKILKVT